MIGLEARLVCQCVSVTTDVMCDVVRGGGVRWVVELLDSTHTVMTNEGLLALNLLAGLGNGEYTLEIC